jgi:hypothetical protein
MATLNELLKENASFKSETAVVIEKQQYNIISVNKATKKLEDGTYSVSDDRLQIKALNAKGDTNTFWCFIDSFPQRYLDNGECTLPFPTKGLRAILDLSAKAVGDKSFIRVHKCVFLEELEDIRQCMQLSSRNGAPLVL